MVWPCHHLLIVPASQHLSFDRGIRRKRMDIDTIPLHYMVSYKLTTTMADFGRLSNV